MEAFKAFFTRYMQPRGSWWDPFNVFGTANTQAPSNVTTTTTPAPVTTTTQSSGGWNPFGFITGPINAIGQAVGNLGNGLVNLVTGGGGTTTTTPFPYPKVAAFFTDPTSIINPNANVTLKPEIVKCLANLINVYGTTMTKIDGFLPGCISGQMFGAVWLVPQALGILPVLDLPKIPDTVISNCKYIDGCVLKAVQTTIDGVDKAIGGISKSINDAMPGLTNIGKSVIRCVGDEFKKVTKDLPKNVELTCLKQ